MKRLNETTVSIPTGVSGGRFAAEVGSINDSPAAPNYLSEPEDCQASGAHLLNVDDNDTCMFCGVARSNGQPLTGGAVVSDGQRVAAGGPPPTSSDSFCECGAALDDVDGSFGLCDACVDDEFYDDPDADRCGECGSRVGHFEGGQPFHILSDGEVDLYCDHYAWLESV